MKVLAPAAGMLLLTASIASSPAVISISSAAPASSGAAPVAAGGAATFRIASQARASSSYQLDARFEVFTKDVTADVPAAYKESFDFWSARMRKTRRVELYQFLTLTEDAAADATVKFRRLLSRFQIDMERNGEELAPPSMAMQDMTRLAWEGTMTLAGDIRQMKLVAGKETEDMGELATPYVTGLFPSIKTPRDMKVGDTFTSEVVLPPPSKLHVEGLEQTRLKMTRDVTLKSAGGDVAVFEIKTTYAGVTPAQPQAGDAAPAGGAAPAKEPSRGASPAADAPTCVISGSGTGEAQFDMKKGVFIYTKQPSTMVIDITAPLRPLPEHPETAHAGMGKTRITLELIASGTQTVHKLVGED